MGHFVLDSACRGLGLKAVCCGHGIVATGHPDMCCISGIAAQALAAEGGSSSVRQFNLKYIILESILQPNSRRAYMCYRFKEKMEEEFSTNLSALGQYFLDWFHKSENCINGADSWFETSGVGVTEYQECEGTWLLSWKSGGYKQVLDLLMVRLCYLIFVYSATVYHLLTLLIIRLT